MNFFLLYDDFLNLRRFKDENKFLIYWFQNIIVEYFGIFLHFYSS